MKPKGLARHLIGASALTCATTCFLTAPADAATQTWDFGAGTQDWNTVTNWTNDAFPNGAGSNAIVNTSTGLYPIISANSSFSPADVIVADGGTNTGRLDHTAGLLTLTDVSTSGTWFIVARGTNTAVGTYNLADTTVIGGGISGFGQGSGDLTVGKFWVGGTHFSQGGTGTVNINTTGTLTANSTQNFSGSTAASVILGTGTGSSGTLNLENGTIQANSELWVGNTGTGVLNQTGGTVNSTSYFVVGRNNGGIGTYNLTGGTVNAATTNAASFAVLGSFTGANGTLNVSGGTFNVGGGNQMLVGEGGTGTLNVSGSGLVTITDATEGLRMGAGASGVGTVNLNGGTIQTAIVTKGAGTGTFNFNGGTLRANASSTTFMTGLTAANVQSGGANIDTNNFNITIGQALLDGGGGGLTKSGLGTLTLSSAANTYTGPTLISNGTLATDLTGNLGTGNVTVADVSGAGLTLGNGSSIADTATLFFGDAGAITLNNATSDTVLGITQTDDSQSIGAGVYTASDLNTFFGVGSFSGTGTLTVVPEPAITLLGGLGLLGILRRRRVA
jgi:autotransporter-associated beta strand protein